MDDAGWFAYAPGGHPATLWVQAVAWVLVVVACLVAVRRPWAWPGLAGGLLGSVASVSYLVDDLMWRWSEPELGAHVFGEGYEHDWPGFIADHGLSDELAWAQALGIALVAVAFLTGAVLSRRARRA